MFTCTLFSEWLIFTDLKKTAASELFLRYYYVFVEPKSKMYFAQKSYFINPKLTNHD